MLLWVFQHPQCDIASHHLILNGCLEHLIIFPALVCHFFTASTFSFGGVVLLLIPTGLQCDIATHPQWLSGALNHFSGFSFPLLYSDSIFSWGGVVLLLLPTSHKSWSSKYCPTNNCQYL